MNGNRADSGASTATTFEFPSSGTRQDRPEDSSQPQHKPRRRNQDDPLGEALSIVGVAKLLGCSVWTVRKKCLPRGLPYFRIGTTGKLVFYRVQVTRWVLEQQERYVGRR